ncbi:hypothetical protein PLESTF_001613800 [Pleodorina starrii]|nr:hypothetical protein PLESTM_001497600 [Pleodorina starrii]GLC75254.1 hypothetical protein PLESTF_001613800 [Pleodorina starrii]
MEGRCRGWRRLAVREGGFWWLSIIRMCDSAPADQRQCTATKKCKPAWCLFAFGRWGGSVCGQDRYTVYRYVQCTVYCIWRGVRGTGLRMQLRLRLEVEVGALHALASPAEVAAEVLRTCTNPFCVNLEGDSEAGLRLAACGRCGAAWYCCRGCQTAHWRTGHRAECSGGAAAAVAVGMEAGMPAVGTGQQKQLRLS